MKAMTITLGIVCVAAGLVSVCAGPTEHGIALQVYGLACACMGAGIILLMK